MARERAELDAERVALDEQQVQAQHEVDALRAAAADAATQLKLAEQQHVHQQQLGFDVAERLSNSRIRRDSLLRRIEQLQQEMEAALLRAEEDDARALALEGDLAEAGTRIETLREQRVALVSQIEGGAAELQRLAQAVSRLEQDEVGLQGQIERAGSASANGSLT